MSNNNFIWALVSGIKGQSWSYKVKILDQPLTTEWSSWLIQPSDTYIETEAQGPYSIKEIEWIDINPIKKQKVGRLMPEKLVDHTEDVKRLLKDLGIEFVILEGMVRIYLRP